MDQDRDGTVSLDDLKEVYASLGNKKTKGNFLWKISRFILGKAPKDSELKAMLEEAQGPINFTMLLTLFGDRLNGTDEENVILNAWKNFDPEGTGFINQKRLINILI
jgi:Ca2+-binding EF-hand superfamily protein